MKPMMLALLWFGALIAGCQSSGGERRAASQPPPTRVVDSHWALVALGGGPVDPDVLLTLSLSADGKASGHAGVNRYFAPYSLAARSRADGSLQFGEIGATRMAGTPEAMKREQEFLDLLRQVDAYRAEGGLLELTGAGRPLLRFRKTQSDVSDAPAATPTPDESAP